MKLNIQVTIRRNACQAVKELGNIAGGEGWKELKWGGDSKRDD
jgi:hypothetical protein